MHCGLQLCKTWKLVVKHGWNFIKLWFIQIGYSKAAVKSSDKKLRESFLSINLRGFVSSRRNKYTINLNPPELEHHHHHHSSACKSGETRRRSASNLSKATVHLFVVDRSRLVIVRERNAGRIQLHRRVGKCVRTLSGSGWIMAGPLVCRQLSKK